MSGNRKRSPGILAKAPILIQTPVLNVSFHELNRLKELQLSRRLVRRGELLALRWSDIDLKASTLTFNQSLERIKGKIEFKAPKTRTSRRTISLPAITVEARERYTTQLEERLKLGLGRDPRALVFSRPDGHPMDADTLSKSFRRLIATAKVTPITFHGLRHTHISHLLMEGVHVKVVSERAGHANVNITLGVYAAYIPNMQADAARRVDAWLR